MEHIRLSWSPDEEGKLSPFRQMELSHLERLEGWPEKKAELVKQCPELANIRKSIQVKAVEINKAGRAEEKEKLRQTKANLEFEYMSKLRALGEAHFDPPYTSGNCPIPGIGYNLLQSAEDLFDENGLTFEAVVAGTQKSKYISTLLRSLAADGGASGVAGLTTCRNGHSLCLGSNVGPRYSQGGNCDGCRGAIPAEAIKQTWSCNGCGYDVCATCFYGPNRDYTQPQPLLPAFPRVRVHSHSISLINQAEIDPFIDKLNTLHSPEDHKIAMAVLVVGHKDELATSFKLNVQHLVNTFKMFATSDDEPLKVAVVIMIPAEDMPHLPLDIDPLLCYHLTSFRSLHDHFVALGIPRNKIFPCVHAASSSVLWQSTLLAPFVQHATQLSDSTASSLPKRPSGEAKINYTFPVLEVKENAERLIKSLAASGQKPSEMNAVLAFEKPFSGMVLQLKAQESASSGKLASWRKQEGKKCHAISSMIEASMTTRAMCEVILALAKPGSPLKEVCDLSIRSSLELTAALREQLTSAGGGEGDGVGSPAQSEVDTTRSRLQFVEAVVKGILQYKALMQAGTVVSQTEQQLKASLKSEVVRGNGKMGSALQGLAKLVVNDSEFKGQLLKEQKEFWDAVRQEITSYADQKCPDSAPAQRSAALRYHQCNMFVQCLGVPSQTLENLLGKRGRLLCELWRDQRLPETVETSKVHQLQRMKATHSAMETAVKDRLKASLENLARTVT